MPFREVFSVKNNLESFYSFRKCLKCLWEIRDYFSFTCAFLKLNMLVIEMSGIKGKLKWIWHWTRTETLGKRGSHKIENWKTKNTTNHDALKKWRGETERSILTYEMWIIILAISKAVVMIKSWYVWHTRVCVYMCMTINFYVCYSCSRKQILAFSTKLRKRMWIFYLGWFCCNVVFCFIK